MLLPDRTVLLVLLALWSPAARAGTDEGAYRHIIALHDIAARNNNTRDAGTPGYDASATYVAEQLEAAGYTVRFEAFEFPVFKEISPSALAIGLAAAPGGTFRTMPYSGADEITAPLHPVKLGLSETAAPATTPSACAAEDFADFPRGAIALVRRGTCTFQDKVRHATAAGAVGVIIMNEGTEGRTGLIYGRLSEPAGVPVVGVTYDYGAELARSDRAIPISLRVDAAIDQRQTRNVLAESRGGDPADSLVIGAHLDSVADGPGLNDNGSGVAAVLETALRIGPETPLRRVRYAFWSAEEHGLLGSRHHLAGLDEGERREIGLYINLDMVGSPNFGRFLYHGDDRPDGSPGLVSRELSSWFEGRGLAIRQHRKDERPRGFGSDDAAFMNVGIPTIGLSTGASETKGDAEAALFGGSAQKPYDPCYHQACDGAANVSRESLDQMTEALTATVRGLAVKNARK